MPTASTGKILGNVEAIEPLGSNIYVDSFLGGKIIVQCDQMVKHLIEIGQWSEQTYMKIKDGKGSIAKIESIPQNVRDIYKTVWEMPQREIMTRAANRQRYIDQAQSLNIHLDGNSDSKLMAVIMHGWKSMLPTGSYYIRTEAAGDAMRNDAVMTAPIVANPLAGSFEAVPPPSTKWGAVSQSGATCDSCGS
jgi:ribonucleoside-diphosphate reductase alpha chain